MKAVGSGFAFAKWDCESGILDIADERRPQAFEGKLCSVEPREINSLEQLSGTTEQGQCWVKDLEI